VSSEGEADRLREGEEGDREDDGVEDGGDVEGPPPAYRVSEDTTQHEANREADGLATTHESECDIAASSGCKTVSNDAYGRWKAKGNGNTSESAEDDELHAIA